MNGLERRTAYRVLTRWRPGMGTIASAAELLKAPLAQYDARLDPHEDYLDVRVTLAAVGFHDARGAAWNLVEDALKEVGLAGWWLDRGKDAPWLANELERRPSVPRPGDE